MSKYINDSKNKRDNKIKLKIISIIFLLLLVLLIFSAKADVLINSNPTANGDNSYTIHPADYLGIGQLLNFSGTYNITAVTFYISKTGLPNALMSVKIYGFPKYPSFISPIISYDVISNSFNTTILTSSLALYNFTFSTSYTLRNDTSYFMLFSIDSYVVMNLTNRVNMRYDGTNPAHYGLVIQKQSNNVIRFLTSDDMIFYIYGITTTYVPNFTFNGNATTQNVLKNQTFYSNSSELKVGNYTQEISEGEFTQDDLDENLVYGLFAGAIVSSFLLVLFCIKNKKER